MRGWLNSPCDGTKQPTVHFDFPTRPSIQRVQNVKWMATYLPAVTVVVHT